MSEDVFADYITLSEDESNIINYLISAIRRNVSEAKGLYNIPVIYVTKLRSEQGTGYSIKTLIPDASGNRKPDGFLVIFLPIIIVLDKKSGEDYSIDQHEVYSCADAIFFIVDTPENFEKLRAKINSVYERDPELINKLKEKTGVVILNCKESNGDGQNAIVKIPEKLKDMLLYVEKMIDRAKSAIKFFVENIKVLRFESDDFWR